MCSGNFMNRDINPSKQAERWGIRNLKILLAVKYYFRRSEDDKSRLQNCNGRWDVGQSVERWVKKIKEFVDKKWENG